MLYYVIRDNTELVGVAQSYVLAQRLVEDDYELQKALQFLKKRFLKLFLKKKASLKHHSYKICVAVKKEISDVEVKEVSDNEVFHS